MQFFIQCNRCRQDIPILEKLYSSEESQLFEIDPHLCPDSYNTPPIIIPHSTEISGCDCNNRKINAAHGRIIADRFFKLCANCLQPILNATLAADK